MFIYILTSNSVMQNKTEETLS